MKSRLISTILVKANLVETNQAGVDLTDANLADADLCRASLIQADLTKANFSNANLSGANLSRCQALGANFTMAENQGSKYDMRGSTFGNFADVVQAGGKQQAVQHIYAAEQKQSLAEAAAEIQKLLKQLEDANPNATETEKIAYVNDETTPSFKRRVVGALQASGETAIDEFILENKYLKVAKAAIKGWLRPGS